MTFSKIMFISFSLIIALQSYGSNVDDQYIDAEQCKSLIESSQAGLEDITFVYEGERTFVGPSRLLKRISADQMGTRFQSLFSYRLDGAMSIEGFERSFDTTIPFKYQRHALIKNQMESIYFYPDRPSPSSPIIKVNTDLNSMYARGTPGFFFYWFFKTVGNYSDHNYKFIGWEVIDQRRAMCFSIGRAPSISDKSGMYFKLWVDLERGGHILQSELYEKSNLSERVEQVRLESMDMPNGKKVWVPVGCEMNSYGWMDQFYAEPKPFFHLAYP